MTNRIMTIAARAMAVLLFAGAAQVATAQHVEDGAFSITLPEGYSKFTKQVQKAGEITATNWISKAPTGEAVVVTMSQMTGKILEPETMMESTRDSLLKSLSATLEKEQADAVETEALYFFRSPQAVFESRLVVDEDRLFQLLYVGRSDEQRNAPAVAQLFQSFEVAKTAPAEAAPAATPVETTSAAPADTTSAQ